MKDNHLLARFAGLSYFILIVAGLFGMVYVPAVVFDWSSPVDTASNLATHEALFRWGIIGCLGSYLAFTVTTTLLYRIFSATSPLAALFLLCFGWIGAVAFIANLLSYVEVVGLIPDMHASEAQRETAGQAILERAANFSAGFKLMQVATGLWLITLGTLVCRSRLLPKAIGALLVISGSLNYIGEFVISFVAGMNGLPWLLTLPGTLAEFSTCLWLLLAGASWQARQRTQIGLNSGATAA